MGKNKSKKQLRQEKRDKKITIVFCAENSLRQIVSVLRFYNNSVLWTKSKYDWTLPEWNEYFELKNKINNA